MLIKIRIKISKFLLLSGWQHLHLYLEENDPPYTLSELQRIVKIDQITEYIRFWKFYK